MIVEPKTVLRMYYSMYGMLCSIIAVTMTKGSHHSISTAVSVPKVLNRFFDIVLSKKQLAEVFCSWFTLFTTVQQTHSSKNKSYLLRYSDFGRLAETYNRDYV